MSIVRLATLVLSVMALLILALGVFGIKGINTIDSGLMDITMIHSPLQSSARDAEILILQHRRAEKDIFINAGNSGKQEEYLGKFEKNSQELLLTLKRIDSLSQLLNPEKQVALEKHLASIQSHYGIYHDAMINVGRTMIADPSIDAGAGNNRMGEFKKDVYSLEEAIDSINALASNSLHSTSEESMQSADRIRVIAEIFIGILLIFAIVTAASFSVFLRKQFQAIIKPVIGITQTWDLRSTVSIAGNNEFSTLANAFNQLLEKLRNSVHHISESTYSISSASEEFAATSSAFTEEMEKMKSSSSNVRDTALRANHEIQGITTSIDGLSSNMETVAAAIEEMNASLATVGESCKLETAEAAKAQKSVEDARTSMDALQRAASKVGEVVDLIDNIAAQTNLLALNATIEAATAGEAGKGFAVVAGEVKDLAKQTSSATNEISQQIEAVQNGVQVAIHSMEVIVSAIRSVNQVSVSIMKTVEEQGTAVQEISLSVGRSSQSSKEVAKTVLFASKELHRAVEGVDAINNSISESTQSSKAIQDASKDLARLATDLQTSVAVFKT